MGRGIGFDIKTAILEASTSEKLVFDGMTKINHPYTSAIIQHPSSHYDDNLAFS